MSTLKMPSITVAFVEKATSAFSRSQKGIVALILKDAIAASTEQSFILTAAAQAPSGLSAGNKKAVERAFLGGVNPPKKVLLYVMNTSATISTSSACLKWLATQQFDYLAGPTNLSSSEAGVIKTWVESQRADCHAIYKAVLPDTVANSEAVINFSAAGIRSVDGSTYTAAEYCGRIAGLIAGTPMTRSVTYAVLPEVVDITRTTPTEQDSAVGAGKLILVHDGEKVKLGRGVNSLTSGKADIWKKIKLVETLDMLKKDIRTTIEDFYIGKVSNTYDNKVQLVAAVSNYLRTVAADGLIEGEFSVGIDMEAQEAYLKAQGVATEDMSEQALRRANTGTSVFLHMTVTPVDAMEDIVLNIEL